MRFSVLILIFTLSLINFSFGNEINKNIDSFELKNNNYNSIDIGENTFYVFSSNDDSIKFSLSGVAHANEGSTGDPQYVVYSFSSSKIFFDDKELSLDSTNYNLNNNPTEISINKSSIASYVTDESLNKIDLIITYTKITFIWNSISQEYDEVTEYLIYTLEPEKIIDVFFDFTQPEVELSDLTVAKSETEVNISVKVDDPTFNTEQEHELVFSNNSTEIFRLPQIGNPSHDSGNQYTLDFGAPSSDGSFFRGNEELSMYIEHTDLAGNKGVVTQINDNGTHRNPIIKLTENEFYIASVHHQKTKNYLKQGSQLKYKFAFEDGVSEQVIDENFSEIVLFNEANEVKKVLYPRDSEVNINTDNNRIILTLNTDILNLFNEGEVIKSFVNLYNTSDPRLNATWTDYHIIDNTKPSLLADPILRVANTEVLSPEWSTEDLTWLQSDSEAIVTLNLNEFDLDKDETSLKVNRVIVDGSNTNEQELSIALDNFTKDNSNLNQLIFKFNPNEGLSNPNKYPTYFTIVGIEAKDIANNSSGRLDLSSSSENYYFSSFDPSIDLSNIIYLQDQGSGEVAVDPESGQLINSQVRITMPYEASALIPENISVRVIGTNGNAPLESIEVIEEKDLEENVIGYLIAITVNIVPGEFDSGI
ncbi:hypothetical protein [Flammeovirga pacifica]|uniref:Uncharacterized protein n=1 Tax=Flammeovirga pacifica TaxID=915059 RepID=A0A1S1YU08_FLAPC|nr:hypothetical protein [Flammeovirga pacifica]OHX64486.1 hypothetical protein NH26_23180 [Flammeovirga pacifica]